MLTELRKAVRLEAIERYRRVSSMLFRRRYLTRSTLGEGSEFISTPNSKMTGSLSTSMAKESGGHSIWAASTIFRCSFLRATNPQTTATPSGDAWLLLSSPRQSPEHESSIMGAIVRPRSSASRGLQRQSAYFKT